MAKRPGKAMRGQLRKDWLERQERNQALIVANMAAPKETRAASVEIGGRKFSLGMKSPNYDFKSKTHKQPYIPFHNTSVPGKVVRGKVVPVKPKSVTSDKDHYKDDTLVRGRLEVHGEVSKDPMVLVGYSNERKITVTDKVTGESKRIRVGGKPMYRVVGKSDTVPNKR